MKRSTKNLKYFFTNQDLKLLYLIKNVVETGFLWILENLDPENCLLKTIPQPI